MESNSYQTFRTATPFKKLSPLIEGESESSLSSRQNNGSNRRKTIRRMDSQGSQFPNSFMTAVGMYENATPSHGKMYSSFDTNLIQQENSNKIVDMERSRSSSVLSLRSNEFEDVERQPSYSTNYTYARRNIEDSPRIEHIEADNNYMYHGAMSEPQIETNSRDYSNIVHDEESEELSRRTPFIEESHVYGRDSPESSAPKFFSTQPQQRSMLPSLEQIEEYFTKTNPKPLVAPARNSPQRKEATENTVVENRHSWNYSQPINRRSNPVQFNRLSVPAAETNFRGYKVGPTIFNQPSGMRSAFESHNHEIPRELVYNELLGPQAFQDQLIDIDFAAIELANMQTSQPVGLTVKNAYRSPDLAMTESGTTVFPDVQYYYEDLPRNGNRFNRNSEYLSSEATTEYQIPSHQYASPTYVQNNVYVNDKVEGPRRANVPYYNAHTSDIFGNAIPEFETERIIRESGAGTVLDRLNGNR